MIRADLFQRNFLKDLSSLETHSRTFTPQLVMSGFSFVNIILRAPFPKAFFLKILNSERSAFGE